MGDNRSARDGLLRCLAAEARVIKPRSAKQDIIRAFDEGDLLTYASAISFQLFFALVPLCLLGLGLLGAFGLSDVWHTSVAPDLRQDVSPAAYSVIDSTVTNVLTHKQLFWATTGAVIAIWEVSGATRAVMGVLNRIYRVKETRSFRQRMVTSTWLAAAVTALFLAAAASINLAPLAIGSSILSVIVRWLVAAGLMLAVVGVLVRFAPDTRRPIRWVSFGSLLVIFGWVVASVVFSWYVTSVADYGSIFGNLAVVMVTLGYIYLSSIVFLTGLQLDSLIRHTIDGFAPTEEIAEEAAPHVIVARSLAEAELPKAPLERQR